MSNELWGDLDRVTEYMTPKYRLHRGLFHWVITRWQLSDYEVGFDWCPHKRFLSKDKALAHLVALKIRGERVEL